MNLAPENQLKLYGLGNQLELLYNLYIKKTLPSKILLSGQKGIGKCTLAYHLINLILSEDEEYAYDINNLKINENNRSYKLIRNKSHQNFSLVELSPEKKNIDINQIRELIYNLNKSNFNLKPRLVLIDNIEFLNVSSINALLKILEEPNENIFFILIHNNTKILSTLKSRCLEFKVSLTNEESIQISNYIFGEDIDELINNKLLNYYITPGNIYNLIRFLKKNELDPKKTTLNDIIFKIIDQNIFKKETSLKYIIYDLLEFFLTSKKSLEDINFYNQFMKKIDNVRKYNLDEESLFMEIKFQLIDARQSRNS